MAGFVRSFFDRLLRDRYDENLFEIATAARRTSPQVVVETGLRAERGEMVRRPLGTPRRLPSFSGLMFRPAQLLRLPVEDDVPVEMAVVIGPQAARPLQIDIPITIAGMAHGLALSAAAKVALARGADLAGTAANTGQGGVIPAERAATRRLVVQYSRAHWAKGEDVLRQADMIEIQLGHGGWAGVGDVVERPHLSAEAARWLELAPGEPARRYARFPEVQRPQDLRPLVERLRALTGGVPVGVKIGPGEDVEADLAVALEAGVDAITIDGAQAGTHGSPPILQDAFGLPTLHVTARAARFLERSGMRGRVTLIAAGGLYVPGDFLKALALGADVVSIGTVALFAVSHRQVPKTLPWEPPTQLVYDTGKYKDSFDPELGARYLANFLRSCAAEMAVGVRAIGKTRVADVDRGDLVALDRQTAEATGVPLVRPVDRGG